MSNGNGPNQRSMILSYEALAKTVTGFAGSRPCYFCCTAVR